MFGLRVDLSIIEVFMDQSSSCTPQFEKATDDIQRNLLFPLSFGALDNIFLIPLGRPTVFHGRYSMVQSIFQALAMAKKELQVCITGDKSAGLQTQTNQMW